MKIISAVIPANEARRSFYIAPLAFLSLVLLCAQIGYLTPPFARALGGVLWLLTVALAAREKKVLYLLLSALLLFSPYGAVHRQEGLWLLGLLPWAGGFWGRRWMGAALICGLGVWISSNFPGYWIRLDELVASTATFSKANLSGAAAGIPIYCIAICFPIAAMIAERRFLPPFLAIVALKLSMFLYWWSLSWLGKLLHSLKIFGMHDAFNLQWALLLLLGIVLIVWGVLDPPRPAPARKRGVALVPALTLIGVLLIGWPYSVGKPTLQKQVIFYNKGYLNWSKPVYGNYGKHSSGMFGLLPEYLKWRGFSVSKQDTLISEKLKNAGVVVIINLMDPLSAAEETAVHDFVSAGGALLLLGDHTGLRNIRDPSNHLLKPYGIELNFDSAKPTRTGWAGSLVCAEHPITAGFGLDRSAPAGNEAATQIWVGASLTVKPPAKPVIVGREGFSDLGNKANEKDGYLGDFRYTLQERLGNLPLLAEAHSGKGKVLVFGDTSTLQNGALVRAGVWVEHIFNYLLSPVTPTANVLRYVGVILLILAMIVHVASGSGRFGLALAALALFLGVIFSQQRQALIAAAPERPWSAMAWQRALLDQSHHPRTPVNQTSVDGPWGLQNCLTRSHLLPQLLKSWDAKALQDARVLIETAPARSFSRSQKRELSEFMQQGGITILCCGQEEFDGSKSLLKDFGLEPLYVPLGPAEAEVLVDLPAEADTLGSGALSSDTLWVSFHEAWEVKVSHPSAEVLLKAYDKPVVVFVPVGKGGLIYVADTDFLANLNLESPVADYKRDNILYLRYLLRRFAGGI